MDVDYSSDLFPMNLLLAQELRASCNVYVCVYTHIHVVLATRQQKVLRIIHDVAGAHVNAASRAIQRSIAETMDEVTFVLDKASIPRPPSLGIHAIQLAGCYYFTPLVEQSVVMRLSIYLSDDLSPRTSQESCHVQT